MDCNNIAYRSLRKDKKMSPHLETGTGSLSQEPSTNHVDGFARDEETK